MQNLIAGHEKAVFRVVIAVLITSEESRVI